MSTMRLFHLQPQAILLSDLESGNYILLKDIARQYPPIKAHNITSPYFLKHFNFQTYYIKGAGKRNNTYLFIKDVIRYQNMLLGVDPILSALQEENQFLLQEIQHLRSLLPDKNKLLSKRTPVRFSGGVHAEDPNIPCYFLIHTKACQKYLATKDTTYLQDALSPSQYKRLKFSLCGDDTCNCNLFDCTIEVGKKTADNI